MRQDANEGAGEGLALRRVAPATAEERLTREEGMARALKVGAVPYRDADGKGRHIAFKDASLAPVEPWVRDPKAKRGYRRTQELRKAAGQLIGEPGDRIEIAKRLGVLHWEQGSDIEGAAARGLRDAIWSREHVYSTFTVPRHDGLAPIGTGRVAALAEEEARKIQAEDPKARGGFWVRDGTGLGLLYVVPNHEPVDEEAEDRAGSPETAEDEVLTGGGADVVLGQADAATDDRALPAEPADTQPARDVDSTAKQEAAPILPYPDIPIATRDLEMGAGADGDGRPVINLWRDRRHAILKDEPAVFDIADSPSASGAEAIYAIHFTGYRAVYIFGEVIELEAKKQGVEPDLVRAMMYTENANGALYGPGAQGLRLADSILPMNIIPELWASLAGDDADLYDPLQNIEAGTRLLKRIVERLADPTVAKVATLYNSLPKEQVTDLGARTAVVYETRAWERKPKAIDPRNQAAMDRERQALRKRLSAE